MSYYGPSMDTLHFPHLTSMDGGNATGLQEQSLPCGWDIAIATPHVHMGPMSQEAKDSCVVHV